MRNTLLIVLTALAMQAWPPATQAQQSWQDRLLDVPYGPLLSSQEPTLLLIRQDFERLQVNRNIGKSPLKIGRRTFQHGIGTHAVSHIRLRSPQPIQRLTASVGVDNNPVTNPGTIDRVGRLFRRSQRTAGLSVGPLAGRGGGHPDRRRLGRRPGG